MQQARQAAVQGRLVGPIVLCVPVGAEVLHGRHVIFVLDQRVLVQILGSTCYEPLLDAEQSCIVI